MLKFIINFVIICFLINNICSAAEDWPTYRHDNRRSGVTSEIPKIPLKQNWVRLSKNPPMMAWSGPAKWDAYSGNKDLQSMRNFDPVFYVTVSKESVYFGSSIDNSVHCLDLQNGHEKWVSFTSGAVRLPPTIDSGNCYFGSDDGNAYCVDSTTGKFLWKYRPASENRFIASNGKIISTSPIRTGVLVQGENVFFGASLVPWEKSYMCALKKINGLEVYVSSHSNMTLQGAFLSSAETIYAPQGRSVPLLFDIKNGKSIKSLSNTGGTFCLLTPDEKFVAMPNNQKSSGNMMQIADPSGSSAMVKFAGADRLLISNDHVYIHQQGKLKALIRSAYSNSNNSISINLGLIKKLEGELKKKRKDLADNKSKNTPEQYNKSVQLISQTQNSLNDLKLNNIKEQKKLKDSFLWQVQSSAPYDLILAGNILFHGGIDRVTAFDVSNGKEVWSAPIKGKAYGLAFSHGSLLVSTTLGHIYSFSH